MKKLTYLLSALLIASIGLVGCDNAEDNEAPTITNLKVNGVAVVDAVSAKAGEVTITFDLADDSEIKNYTVLAGSTSLDSKEVGADKKSVTVTYNLVSSVIITINVTDDDDKTTTKPFNLNKDGNISAFEEKLLGSYLNTSAGSFLATVTGTVYTQATAFETANQSKIDMLYYFGATNKATLAAPNDDDAATIYNNATTGLQKWTTKNATKFKMTTLTAAQFTSVTTDTELMAAFDAVAGTGDSFSKELAIGKVVAFKTAAGKYGLANVTALVENANGSIKILVKVGK